MIFFALPPGHRGSIEERIRERRDPETSEGVVQVEIRLELRAERRTGADRRSHPHPIARDNSGMSSSDAAQSSVNADARAGCSSAGTRNVRLHPNATPQHLASDRRGRGHDVGGGGAPSLIQLLAASF
jgi:hypothetical protein